MKITFVSIMALVLVMNSNARADRFLLAAVKKGNVVAFKKLLKRGEDFNSVDAGGRSLLMISAEYGRLEMSQLLLQRGVDPDAVDKEGRTALMYASRAGHNSVVTLLNCGQETASKYCNYSSYRYDQVFGARSSSLRSAVETS